MNTDALRVDVVKTGKVRKAALTTGICVGKYSEYSQSENDFVSTSILKVG